MQEIDYGPLAKLIGVWTGDKGVDVAPEPDGVENNGYYENIVFTGVGDVTNAESQVLVAVHYRQIVQRKSNDKVFHDETGYWMWDEREGIVMHSLTIPRGVCLLAGGEYKDSVDGDARTVLNVSAAEDDSRWQINQSPFMQANARTTAFSHEIIIDGDKLSYAETTVVEIYGKVFDHTDRNRLIRV